MNESALSSDAFFRMHPVFTRDEYALSRPGSAPRTIDSLLRKHLAAGRISRVRRSLYQSHLALGPRADADPFLIAAKVAPDAVISHHAALQFHGCVYSIWHQITFFTGHAVVPFAFRGVDFIPVRPPEPLASLDDDISGIERLPMQVGHLRICTLERTMVDVLHAPGLGGGWEEVFRSLDMVPFFDLEQVIRITLALGCSLTTGRVGLYLSLRQQRLFVEPRHLERLAAVAPRQARYLDTTREPGRLIRPWNLIVPDRLLTGGWEEPG